jgi:DNA-binding PadR family transcriptional regulator
MAEARLTPTSYIVLGLVERMGEATPYDLKGLVAAGLGNFWSVQHAQLYSETERLAGMGLLAERREEGGRRRRMYSLTDAGRRALREWLATPTRELTELRDLGLLKIFFGADPRLIAAEQLEAHREKLAEYEALAKLLSSAGGVGEGAALTLDAGLGHEREYVRFWERLANG